MKIEQTVEIGREVDRVFEYATDPATWPEWASAFRDVERVGDGPVQAGSVFRARAAFMGHDVRTDFEVSAIDAPRLFAYRAVRGPVPGDFRWSFAPLPGGTRFTFSVEGKARGIARLMASAAATAVRAQVRRDLDRLKKLLEADG